MQRIESQKLSILVCNMAKCRRLFPHPVEGEAHRGEAGCTEQDVGVGELGIVHLHGEADDREGKGYRHYGEDDH